MIDRSDFPIFSQLKFTFNKPEYMTSSIPDVSKSESRLKSRVYEVLLLNCSG